MRAFLLGLAGGVIFLLGACIVYAANGRPRFRYRQLLLPVVALVYAAVAVWRFNDLNALIQSLLAQAAAFVPLLGNINAAFLESALFNFLILTGFTALKGLYKLIVALFEKAYSKGMKRLVGKFYTYDEDYQRWFLREDYYGLRRLARNLYVCVLLATTLLLIAASVWANLPAFRNPFYPSVAVLVLGEVCFCLFGQSREEYLEGVDFEEDGATRVFQYAKLQEVLKHYFGDRLLHMGSRGVREGSPGTHDDFCEELMASDDFNERLAGGYFKSLVDRGVLGEGAAGSSYDALNHDMALESIRMLQGNSVLFATPFYRDSVPYVFLPLNAQLMRGRRAIILYGPEASEESLLDYAREGLDFATGIPGMWKAGATMQAGMDGACDVALVSFSSLVDVKGIIDAAEFLKQVGFVIVIDPSSLLATYQIGLNYLAEYLSEGVPVSYCIFDRNSDGLVDSLSHALRTNLTEVSATEYAEGSSVYMMWDADGDNLQHRLVPGVAQYLGVGTEIGLVALKSQISKLAWASASAVPLVDQRWIDGQYYGELFSFAELPQEQLTLDRSFEWYSDPWSMPKEKNRFMVVEDEYANMFEAFRQFSTRGTQQVFVNVISPHYLLRDYMADNAELFLNDPKAVPSLAPDFSKSQRNVIFSLVMVMAQTGEPVSEEEVAARLRYVGLPFNNVEEALRGLLIDHLSISEDYQGVLPEDQLVVREVEEYDPVRREFVMRRYFGLSDKAMYSACFSSLRSVPLITELPDGSQQLLGARLYGHVYQQFLPGQFTVIGGKYYEVVSVSGTAGVVLRRAADHFSQRRYYRQLKRCVLEGYDLTEGTGATRTISSVIVQRIEAKLAIETRGYLELSDYGDLASARRVELSDVPARSYANKTALRLEFPGANPQVVLTLGVVINELFVTLFPKDKDYIFVVTPCSHELEQGILPEFSGSDDGCALYIIEDSLIDIGLVSCIDRNIKRILELAWDYIDWHNSKLLGKDSSEPQWEVGSAPDPVAPSNEKRGFIRRIVDKLKGLFGGKKGTGTGAGANEEEEEEEDASAGEGTGADTGAGEGAGADVGAGAGTGTGASIDADVGAGADSSAGAPAESSGAAGDIEIDMTLTEDGVKPAAGTGKGEVS